MPLPYQALTTLLLSVALYVAHAIYHHHAKRRLTFRAGCEPFPQYPHKDPLFGSDLHKIQAEGTSEGRVLNMRWKLYSQYSKTFGSNWNGQRVLNTMESENIEAVLGTSARSFIMSPLRNRIALPFLGKGLLTSDGKVWQHNRRVTAAALSTPQAVDLTSLEKHLARLLEIIPTDGTTIDLQPLFKRLSTDQGTLLVLGESVSSLSATPSEEVEGILALFERILRIMGARLRLGHLRFIRGPDLQWRRDCREAYAILDGVIDRAIERRAELPWKERTDAGSKVGYSLVDQYLDITQDRKEIQTQLINVYLAGRDQFGISLSLLFFALARHPAVWQKIREEALKCSSTPNVADLKALSYTRNVVFEGFRLYSPILRVIRHCHEDCVLPRGGGDGQSPIFVTRGTQVEMDIGNMHQDADLWGQDAGDFRPERWHGRAAGWDYIPFSGGSRYCPAKHLVLTHMSYVVVRLAQEFKTIENKDPVLKLVDDVRNVRQSRNGVLVAVS